MSHATMCGNTYEDERGGCFVPWCSCWCHTEHAKTAEPTPEAIDALRALGTRHMREYIDALAEHGVDLTHFDGSVLAYDTISAYHLAKAHELDRQRTDGGQESQESRPETSAQDGPGYTCGGVVTGGAGHPVWADPEHQHERYIDPASALRSAELAERARRILDDGFDQ